MLICTNASSTIDVYSEDGISMFLHPAGTSLPDYTLSHCFCLTLFEDVTSTEDAS